LKKPDAVLERTVEILSELVAFPTVSADSNLAMIDYLAQHLGACGAKVDLMHRLCYQGIAMWCR